MRKPYRKSSSTSAARWVFGGFGLLFLILSLIMLLSDRAAYSRAPQGYPTGFSVAGIPIGGLSEEQALERLEQVFDLPVELRYKQARMQFPPADLGFTPDYQASLAAVNAQAATGGWWSSLWGKTHTPPPRDFPLVSSSDTAQAQAFLQAVLLPRYGQFALAPTPNINLTTFSAGQPGEEVDITSALPLIEAALASTTNRVVDLPITTTPQAQLDRSLLEPFLKHQIKLDGYPGLVEVYLQDLETGEILHFAERGGQAVTPDVAYTGASTVKIPIMLSVMKQISEPTPNLAGGWMRAMIRDSLNPPADALMKTYLDPNRGPLIVTEDLRALGYQNTFLAGFFEPGSPLLARIETPANQRRDVFLDPDLYNQTVPSETGDLLQRIYTCSQPDSAGMFDGAVTPTECQEMIGYLKENRLGVLIEAGVGPDSTVAHKHGWVTSLDGLVHSMSDAALVYTPGRDYALVIFIHLDEQLLFDRGNRLFARLSQTIYNSYNLEQQAAWPLK